MRTEFVRNIFCTLLALSITSMAQANDLKTLESARRQYNKGNFQKSVEIYDQISKGSDYYLDALEEKAQAYGQQGKYAEALSELKSAMAPQFQGLTSSKVYLTSVITQLKTCDYEGVLTGTEKFKKEFRERIAHLKEIANSETSKLRNQAVQTIGKMGLNFNSLGSQIRSLPRNLVKDKIALKYSKNPIRLDRRMRQLAKSELSEINIVIEKLRIAEVEVQHRLNILEESGRRSKQGGYANSTDYLIFPESEEVWIDEIGNFQGQIEKCPSFSRRVSL